MAPRPLVCEPHRHGLQVDEVGQGSRLLLYWEEAGFYEAAVTRAKQEEKEQGKR